MKSINNEVTILLYHNFLDKNADHNNDKGSIRITNFMGQLEALEQNGYQNLPLKNIIDYIILDREIPKKTYAITFDDGFESLFHYLPGLMNRIKPTVFIVTDYVGQSNLWNKRSTNKLFHMSLDMIHKLQENGVDFQFHGTDHHNLVKFSSSELEDRFQTGCRWFEEHLQTKPDYIAYPYGAFNERVVKVARKYFKNGLSVNHGGWYGTEASFKINRISVPFYASGEDLVNVIKTPPKNMWLAFENNAPWVTNHNIK